MNFKTAFLTSAAAAFLIASPALAQEAAPATQDPAAAPSTAAPAQQSLSLTPGTSVRGPDGELGKLEGVQNGASGQELTVRDAAGALKAVPLGGIRQDGADVVVAYTKVEFDAAAPIPGAPAAPAAAPVADPSATMPATDPATTEPVDPSGSSDPMAPPTGDQPQA
ncbi:hypothetical protein [Brevundimonas sp.]|jgi:hypothetical protein|uniref:hypothetical protein n=1 Tax=Brevundimonas sp. TaxID=1871086 RepID=UPI0037C17507